MSLLEALTTTRKGALVCNLCAHRCVLPPGKRGICGAIAHEEGRLRSLVAGQPVVLQADPVERKPLYHVYPGSRVFSLGTLGCNMTCSFCQNWRISQQQPDGTLTAPTYTPEMIIAAAQAQGCAGIAFTYNEPTIYLDDAAAIMRLAQQAGRFTIFKSNGYLTPEATAALDGLLDAVNIDLKGFDDGYYRRVCGARLQPVCDAIADLYQRGIWVEVTTLLIPGINDSDAELRALTGFLAEVSRDIPWHLWRFHPDYQMTDRPWTHVRDLERAAQIGRAAGLRYIYAGNTPGDPRQQTRCPGCDTLLIARHGNTTTANHLRDGACGGCGYRLPGRFVTREVTG
jgi:pyruvate formate lyase activating enzyme